MRHLRAGAVLLLAMLLTLTGRLLVEGQRACAQAEAARDHGDQLGARRGYERALGAYVPFAPHVRRAVSGLQELAVQALRAGHPDDERVALSVLRAGLLAARSFQVPFGTDAERASARLAILTGTSPNLWWPPPQPRPWALALGAAGLAAMGGAVLVLGPRALSRQLRAKPRAAVAMGLAFTVGLLLFMVGMRLA